MAVSANSRLLALPPSGIRVVHDRKRATSIDLTIGQPSLKPDPEPFVVAAEWIRKHGCPYPPYAGLPDLRSAVAGIYGGRFHDKPDNVCVTNGSQEAIYLTIKALLQPDKDEVLVVNPGYPSYSRCCDLEGIKWRAVAAHAGDGFRVRASAVLDALAPATRLIALGSPANPSGAILPQEDIEALTRGLSERPGPPVLVLVDEVYRELTYTPSGFRTLADHYPNTIVVQSLSKCCALTGLRLGFFIGPVEAVQMATRAHMLMLMSVSLPAQRVAIDIFGRPERLRAHRPWYEAQRAMMLECARQARIEIIEPEGAFYVLVALPTRWRADSLGAAYALLDEFDVVTVPGSVFGSQAEGFLRFTWAADEASVREGMARLGEFLHRHA
jgi:aspartate/methionine/tyrosine aminotransferase